MPWGPRARWFSYEVRPGAVAGARRNIEELLPSHTNHTIKLRDPLTEGIGEFDLDRAVMDIPEPWKWVQAAAEALRPGGLLLCYLPTVLQVHELGVSLLREPRFHLVQTVEVLERPWHATIRSVRPEHRMVAPYGIHHYGTARRCQHLGHRN